MAYGKPIPLHQWLFVPDLSSSTPGCITDADGMIPTIAGARTGPSLVAVSSALPGPCLGAFLSILSGGGFNNFAGTGLHLYRLLGGLSTVLGLGTTYDQFTALYAQYQNLPHLTYGDASFRPPPPTVTPGPTWVEVDGGQTFSGQPWSFAQAGDDAIATNGADPVQVYIGGGTQFAPLGGMPPIAKFVTTVDPGAGASVVTILANLVNDATGWVASGPGNDTVWTRDVADLSAASFLRSAPGPITGAKTVRTFAVLSKQNALYIGRFVGPPFVWDFQPVSHQIGFASNNAAVNVGDLLVFPGPDDFYSFDAYSLDPIPNALREWFFGQPGNNNGIADPKFYNTIVGHYDEINATVTWNFASVNANPAGTLDMSISWNKKSGRWLPGHPIIQAAPQGGFGQPGTTYDQFTARSRYGRYNQLPHLTYGDSSFGPGTQVANSVILPDGRLYTYTGPPNSGYLRTGDIGDDVRLTRINRLRTKFGIFPAVATNSQRALLSSFVRRNSGDTYTPFKTGVPLSDSGYFDFREAAGWHSLLMQFQSDAELHALTPDIEDAGYR